MHPFQLVMEFIPCGDLYSFLNDPDGVQKYLSRIDDGLEKDVLPVKRSFEAYKVILFLFIYCFSLHSPPSSSLFSS